MPSKSAAQHRLMEAAAHTPGGYGGVPQKVGKDFVRHDGKGHGGSTRGKKDFGGRKHRGSSSGGRGY